MKGLVGGTGTHVESLAFASLHSSIFKIEFVFVVFL